MDILEILQYFSEKYNFDEEDRSLIDEITNQMINGEYEEDYEDEDDKDIAEEDYEDEEDY